MAATGLGPALDECPSRCVRPLAWYRAHVGVGEDLHPTRRSSSPVLPTNTGPPRVEHPGQAARPAWTRTTTESGASDNALASRTENPLGRSGIPRTCVTRSGPPAGSWRVVRVSLPTERDTQLGTYFRLASRPRMKQPTKATPQRSRRSMREDPSRRSSGRQCRFRHEAH
jgi:hypothetical protein